MKTYKDLVIGTNRALKEDCKTFGYNIKLLNEFKDMPKELKPYLVKLKKDKEFYQKASKEVRTTKAGAFRPFYTLQYLYRLYKSESK